MNCPKCGCNCVLIIVGQDEFGVIREWSCINEECMWQEGDGFPASGTEQK